jgi:putative endonuclease
VVAVVSGKCDVGASGERIAGEYLKLVGYKILETNLRLGHLEIDLIAEKNGCLVFVEVKTRRSDSFGDALESVSHSKLVNMRRAARMYISGAPRRVRYAEYRFDLVAIDLDRGEAGLVLRHLKGIT